MKVKKPSGIMEIFEKASWVKHNWATEKVRQIQTKSRDGKIETAYESQGGSINGAYEDCAGVCAEGAIEHSLGLLNHNEFCRWEDTRMILENRAKVWSETKTQEQLAQEVVTSVDWFRGLIQQVAVFYSNLHLRDFLTAQADGIGLKNGPEDTYWHELAGTVSACIRNDVVGSVSAFNDNPRTEYQDVRAFLMSLGEQPRYRTLQNLARMDDTHLEVFRAGYIPLARQKLTASDDLVDYSLTRASVEEHYALMVGANVI